MASSSPFQPSAQDNSPLYKCIHYNDALGHVGNIYMQHRLWPPSFETTLSFKTFHFKLNGNFFLFSLKIMSHTQTSTFLSTQSNQLLITYPTFQLVVLMVWCLSIYMIALNQKILQVVSFNYFSFADILHMDISTHTLSCFQISPSPSHGQAFQWGSSNYYWNKLYIASLITTYAFNFLIHFQQTSPPTNLVS